MSVSRSAQIDPTWRERTVETRGIALHVVEAGPADGRPLVLLHGFPEFWYAWKRYLSPLAAAGYRVLVPDQRGYNRSAGPPGTSSYAADTLAADVVALIDSTGRQRATLVGHDFGGYVGWWTAARHPSRVDRLVVLNCPHPQAMLASLLTNPRQIAKSWYIFLLQMPWLPERIMRFNSFVALRSIIRERRHGDLLPSEDEAAYVEAWSQGNAITTMINWYRAAFRTSLQARSLPRITVPVLVIWGERDRYLSRSLAQASVEYCDSARVTYVAATHWLHHEAPEVVNGLILQFLGERAPPRERQA